MHLKIFWLQVIEVHLKVTEETRTKLAQIIRFQLDLLQTGSGDSGDIGQALSFSLFALLVHSHGVKILSTWGASCIATQAERELLLVSVYQSQGRLQRAWPELRVNQGRLMVRPGAHWWQCHLGYKRSGPSREGAVTGCTVLRRLRWVREH